MRGVLKKIYERIKNTYIVRMGNVSSIARISKHNLSRLKKSSNVIFSRYPSVENQIGITNLLAIDAYAVAFCLPMYLLSAEQICSP